MVVGLALGEKRRVVGRRLLLILRLAVIIRLRRLLLLLGKTGFSVSVVYLVAQNCSVARTSGGSSCPGAGCRSGCFWRGSEDRGIAWAAS